MATSIVLIAACTHQRAPTQYDTAARQRSGTSVASQPAPQAAAAMTTASGGETTTSVVNKELVKQGGYHTRMRNGQVVYCRADQLTGTRFRQEVCLTERQIGEAQRQARDANIHPLGCNHSGCPGF
jgi:hypothetical protein